MKKVLSVLALLFGVSLMLAQFPLAQTFASEAKTLKIGIITSMTGPMAPAFKSFSDSAKPVEDLLNQRGGVTVKGEKYNIKIVAEDDQSSPAGAMAAISRLIQDNIKFMYAPQFPVSNMAISQEAEQAKILRIKALGVSKEEIGPALHYSFYASADAYNIPVCYHYLANNYPKVKKIAVITPDDPGGKFVQEEARKAIKAGGYDLVFWEAFKIGTEDFYPILTRALERKPDAIDMVISIVPWAAGVINQSRELSFTGPVFGSILADTNILNSMLNKKYAYDVFHGGPDVLSPKMKPIVKDLREIVEKQLNTTFNMDHTMPLDGLYALMQAIEKAQSLDSDKVATTLENMKSIDTIYGKGTMGGQELFGINHVIRRPVTLSRIMNGKVEFDFFEK